MKKTLINGINKKSILFYSMMLFMTSETFTQPPPPPAQPPCLPDCLEDPWEKAYLEVDLPIPPCNRCKVTIEYWYRHAVCIEPRYAPPDDEVDDYDFQITGIKIDKNCNNCVNYNFNVLSLYSWAVDQLIKELFVNVWNFPSGCNSNWRMTLVTCWTKWIERYPFFGKSPQDSMLRINPCQTTNIECCFKQLNVCYDRSTNILTRTYDSLDYFFNPMPSCGIRTNGDTCLFACDHELEPPFYGNGDPIPFWSKNSTKYEQNHLKELRLIYPSGKAQLKINDDIQSDFKFEIFDVKGRLLFSSNGYINFTDTIDLSSFMRGSYYFRILSIDGISQSDFFIIE